MPKDEWRSANHRARYGSTTQPNAQRRRGRKKRKGQERHLYVGIGQCVVMRSTHNAVELTLPEGRVLWVPRSVTLNGNARVVPGQVLGVRVDKWYAVREKIKVAETARRETNRATPANPYPTEAQF